MGDSFWTMIPLLVAGFALFIIAVMGVCKAFVALFSKGIRAEIRAQPWRHGAWFLFSFVMLAGAVLPFASEGRHYRQYAKKASARNDVAQIVTAMKAYHTEYGVMPDGDRRQIVEVLLGKNKREIAFINLPQNVFNAAHEFVDPWGAPYRIGMSHGDYAWAYSCGRDGKDDGGAAGSDDVTSWRDGY